jgi:hypothetical protein
MIIFYELYIITKVMNNQLDSISGKIYNHFTRKYPAFFPSLNLSQMQIRKILSTKQNRLHDKAYVSSVINSLDNQIQTKMHTNHSNTGYARAGNTQPNSARQIMPVIEYVQDTETKIPYSEFLNNYKCDETPKQTTSNEIADSPIDDSPIDNTKAFNDIMKARGIIPKALNTSESNVINRPVNKEDVEEKEETIQTQFEPHSESFLESDKKVVSNLMSPEKIYREYYVGIDSKDRDTTKFSAPNEYQIAFAPSSSMTTGYIDSGFQNVVSIELIEALLIDSGSEANASDNGATYPYLLLEIEELGGMFDGTNKQMSESFAILKKYETQNGYKYYDLMGGSVHERIIRVFNPRMSLNKMTIRITTPDGTIFNFGDANTSNANTVNYFLFKVKTCQKNLSTEFMENTTF